MANRPRKLTMFYLHLVKFLAVTVLTVTVSSGLSQSAFDTASNYDTTWQNGNAGTGYTTAYVGSATNTGGPASQYNYTLPVATAANYGGSAAHMDSSGKSFIFDLTPHATALVWRERRYSPRVDGTKASLKAQAIGGKMQISFLRGTTGLLGRVMTDNSNWGVRLGATWVHVSPFAYDVPVEITVTAYDTTNTWDAEIKNLLTSEVSSVAGVVAQLGAAGSGGISGFSVTGLAKPDGNANYIFNDLKVTPPPPPAKVENFLDY